MWLWTPASSHICSRSHELIKIQVISHYLSSQKPASVYFPSLTSIALWPLRYSVNLCSPFSPLPLNLLYHLCCLLICYSCLVLLSVSWAYHILEPQRLLFLSLMCAFLDCWWWFLSFPKVFPWMTPYLKSLPLAPCINENPLSLVLFTMLCFSSLWL